VRGEDPRAYRCRGGPAPGTSQYLLSKTYCGPLVEPAGVTPGGRRLDEEPIPNPPESEPLNPPGSGQERTAAVKSQKKTPLLILRKFGEAMCRITCETEKVNEPHSRSGVADSRRPRGRERPDCPTGAHMPNGSVPEKRRSLENPGGQQLWEDDRSAGDARPGGACGREVRDGPPSPRCHWHTEIGDDVARVEPRPEGDNNALLCGERDRGGVGTVGGANRREANRACPTQGTGANLKARNLVDERGIPARDNFGAAGPRAETSKSVRECAPSRSPLRAAPGAAEGTKRGEG